MLLSGEPGIGKSRLVQALREATRGERRVSLRYHGSPYHANDALWPVVQQLVRAAGLGPEDSTEARLDKVEALLARAVADPRVPAPYLARLLGSKPVVAIRRRSSLHSNKRCGCSRPYLHS